MKIKSFRKYKYDLSDVANVFYTMKGNRKEKVEKIKKAFKYLYDSNIMGERLKYLHKLSAEDVDVNHIREYESMNSNVIKRLDRKKKVEKSTLDEMLAGIDKIEDRE